MGPPPVNEPPAPPSVHKMEPQVLEVPTSVKESHRQRPASGPALAIGLLIMVSVIASVESGHVDTPPKVVKVIVTVFEHPAKNGLGT